MLCLRFQALRFSLVFWIAADIYYAVGGGGGRVDWGVWDNTGSFSREDWIEWWSRVVKLFLEYSVHAIYSPFKVRHLPRGHAVQILPPPSNHSHPRKWPLTSIWLSCIRGSDGANLDRLHHRDNKSMGYIGCYIGFQDGRPRDLTTSIETNIYNYRWLLW